MRRLRKKRFWFIIFASIYAVALLISEWHRPTTELPDISDMDCREAEPHAAVVLITRDGGVWVCRISSGEHREEQLGIDPRISGASVSEFSDAVREALGKEYPFHLITYGYGAPVGVRLASQESENVLSLLLIDPHGLTEFEWLGNALIDRSLRSAESLALWFYDRAVPFSWKSDIPLRKMRWESDIVAHSNLDQTRKDIHAVLIPVGIATEFATKQAEEWHRIIPQAEWVDTNTLPVLSSFFGESERIAAQGLPVPDPQRIDESAKDYNELFRTALSGNALILAVVLIALSTLISEDLACVGAGLLVSQGGIGALPAAIGCLVGIYFGDIAIYLLGRLFGELLVRKRPFRWFISPRAVRSCEVWFKNQGNLVLLASRFMPGTRVPVYFAAGALKSPFWLVSLILAGAAVLWVPILIYFSYIVGDKMLAWFEQYEQMAIWGVLAVFLLVLVFTHNLLPLLTYRGRRLLYSRWKRWTHWEFWPAKAIYPPVFLYVMYLGLRYRSIALGSLVNPMVPCGGFVGESKIDILNHLRDSGAPVAPFTVLDPDRSVVDLVETVEQAQSEWGQAYPLVLKPDQGERGKGVAIMRTPEQLKDFLSKLKEPYIAQQYVDGQEFGVFYYRYPGQSSGVISSITRKLYTTVIGDGKSTLEHLVLKDPRAVCSARTFLKQHQSRLFRIPEEGEEVKLVEIGTHARGSLFLDACELATPALLKRMDEIGTHIDGFYLGRFDLKVPGDEALKKGEGIQIIELNLLTSEPTHIYDPKHSLFYAWRALIRQWQTAYEIADLNRKAGLKPLSHLAVITKIWSHFING